MEIKEFEIKVYTESKHFKKIDIKTKNVFYFCMNKIQKWTNFG